MSSSHGRNGSVLISLILLIGLIGGGAYYAAGHHFVMTGQGFRIYPKKTVTFEHTYVDLRQCDMGELYQHRDVLRAMAAKGELSLAADNETMRKLAMAGAVAGDAIRTKAHQVDQDYKVSDSAREIGRVTKEKYQQADEKYQLRERAAAAKDKMKQKAQRFNSWLKSQ